ncbi:colicin immunity protein [Rosenbergiella australiborealis]|uniref:Colicin immunity protein n=1 Tax=Rosenbergiella australiborealis TaxID=1544696 RepID=A0ABS5TAK3_9GAMM|nr:colicin immunity domain-containing protein [Rosenbergiella australiborealis]MBT0728535.1 colicin immunity protein [Rosenbergiella australiborealis]
MSFELKSYIDNFISGKTTANEFVDNYMCKWKHERDSKLLGNDEDNLSELLSSTFCIADMYNPDEDRDEYEFNDVQLRNEVYKLVLVYEAK